MSNRFTGESEPGILQADWRNQKPDFEIRRNERGCIHHSSVCPCSSLSSLVILVFGQDYMFC